MRKTHDWSQKHFWTNDLMFLVSRFQSCKNDRQGFHLKLRSGWAYKTFAQDKMLISSSGYWPKPGIIEDGSNYVRFDLLSCALRCCLRQPVVFIGKCISSCERTYVRKHTWSQSSAQIQSTLLIVSETLSHEVIHDIRMLIVYTVAMRPLSSPYYSLFLWCVASRHLRSIRRYRSCISSFLFCCLCCSLICRYLTIHDDGVCFSQVLRPCVVAICVWYVCF